MQARAGTRQNRFARRPSKERIMPWVGPCARRDMQHERRRRCSRLYDLASGAGRRDYGGGSTMSNSRTILALFVAATLALVTPALAQKPFADVGKQPPITVLIGSTPWYPAFEKVVGAYEQQTGNRIKLDVTPFANI